MSKIKFPAWLVVPCLVLCLFVAPSQAANSVKDFSVTASTGSVADPVKNDAWASVGYAEVTWTSSASGDAVFTTNRLGGVLERVVYAPVAAASPTANYDVIVKDEYGLTIAGGTANNLSATAASQEVPKIATVVSSATTHVLWRLNGPITVTVDNAGNAKKGKVVFYFSDYR